MDYIDKKIGKLREVIRVKGELAVGFSGGIDSSLIACVAYQELGDKAVAVTIDSDTFSDRELKFSKKIADEIGLRQILVETSELENPKFVENSADRCYHCKKEEIEVVVKGAASVGISTVAFGVNTSDFGEHRPGIQALKEAGVFMPLLDADTGKADIPEMARRVGLSNYDMPSTTCLASRVPYGDPITADKLNVIEKSEDYLVALGITMSRVRIHGTIARIEVPDNEMDIVMTKRADVYSRLRELGFTYVSLDLKGYVSGSMNKVLDK